MRSDGSTAPDLLVAGRNCWRRARAERTAFIIDADAYFRAVRESLCRARRSIFIVGWDVHSELRLIHGGADDGLPERLGPLLDRLVRQRPDLHVYILNWDFAMIFALEREFLPVYKLRWKSHRRVHFCLDGNHPVGASQHQKIVVIDDRVAYVGGLDLTGRRWDTPEHALGDERRVGPDGKPYPPFHDVQMAVDGEAAAALGELARDRWRTAGSREPVASPPGDGMDPWPPSLQAAIGRGDVGIARTLPAFGDRAEAREVERLHLDAIAAARTFIYAENQYLSSHVVGEALARRLEERDGPDVVLVVPDRTGGWLEQHTMDVLRARLLRRLRDADRHGRLRVYRVRLARDPDVSLMVHAKVMIVDDVFVRVGSSNLSNRSMGLDSECDLAIEAGDDPARREAIGNFRRRLLAEHLGVGADALAETERRDASLIEVVESLRGGERSLEPLRERMPPEVDAWVPDAALLDPERPVEPDQLFDQLVAPGQRPSAYRHLRQVGLLLVGLLALAAAWRWTPFAGWLDVNRVAATVRQIAGSPLAPVLVPGAYVIGGLVAVPVTLLIIATVSVFGPWTGGAYALVGAELAALAGFGMGRLLGRDAVRRLAGSRVNQILRLLSRRGVLTVLTLRIVPIAPFTVINVIGGISGIRLRDFAIGSLLGLLPGVIAFGFLADRLVVSLRERSAGNVAFLAGTAAAIVVGVVALRRWSRRRAAPGG